MASRFPAGFIFGCTQETEHECREKKLFGLPGCRCQAVERIRHGTPLFLYNYDCKVLYGVFKAKGKGSCNIDPDAWHGRFPAQIRVEGIMPQHRRGECLLKDDFQHAIRENFFTKHKFRYALSHIQVKRLRRLYECARESREERRTEQHWSRIAKPGRSRGRRHHSRERTTRRQRRFADVRGQRVMPRDCAVEFQTPAHRSASMESKEQTTFIRTPASNLMDYREETEELTPYVVPAASYQVVERPTGSLPPRMIYVPVKGDDQLTAGETGHALPRSSWGCEVLDVTLDGEKKEKSRAVKEHEGWNDRWVMDEPPRSDARCNQTCIDATRADYRQERGVISLEQSIRSLTEKFQNL